MAETQKNSAKKYIIEQIMLDVNAIPLAYLKTLHAIIHSFKENIVTIQPQEDPQPLSETSQEDNFDWDDFLNDIHINRQKNNTLLYNRSQKIAD